jgi:site-specific DNA-methyltransferase (adenine-specific)
LTEKREQLAELGYLNQPTQGDCLDLLKKLPDGCIDLVLCDLPFGTTQNGWDAEIDLESLWRQYDRVVKPDGAVLLNSHGVYTAKVIMSNAAHYKYKYVWVKSKATNFLNAKKQPLRKHEDICVFYRRSPSYEPQMTSGEPYDKGVRKSQYTGSYREFEPVHVRSSGDRYPTDVLYFKTAESEGEVWHPTQKPVALGRYLIRTFSRPGDVVLDNAFGSGSYLVAAVLESRNFVGFEQNLQAVRFKQHAADFVALAGERVLGAYATLGADALAPLDRSGLLISE